MDKIYLAVSELALIQDKEKLYRKVKEVMPEIKKHSGEKVKEELKEKNLNLTNVAKKLEIDLGGFSKRLSSGLALPYNSLTYLSHKLLHKSCQEVFLGFYTPAILPKDLSWVITAMEKNTSLKDDLTGYIDSLYKKEGDKSYKVDANALILERLEEYASDRGLRLDNLFGVSIPGVYTGIKSCVEKKRNSPQLSTVAFYALAFNTSIDYFISLDYTGISLGTAKGVCLFGESRVIKERRVLTFISKYLRLSRQGKNLVFARALSLAIKARVI